MRASAAEADIQRIFGVLLADPRERCRRAKHRYRVGLNRRLGVTLRCAGVAEPGAIEQEIRDRLAHALDAAPGLRATLHDSGPGAERVAIQVLAHTVSALTECMIMLAGTVDGLMHSRSSWNVP